MAEEESLSAALSKSPRKVMRYGDDFEVKPLQGWVLKEPKDTTKKEWEKRWLVLEKDNLDRPLLVYYSDDLKHTIKGCATDFSCDVFIEKIPLSHVKDIRKNATGRAHCFGVVTSERVYWFQVDSEVNYSKWTISIKAQAKLGLF